MTETASGQPLRRAGRHPLAVLRARSGYTHGGFARLVADTHAALGFGHMAARREKVSRWESGRAVPEHTAQLAIAHLMSVPDDEVLRRGWPHWLHLATGDASAVDLPWLASSVSDAVRDAVHERPGERADYLLVRGHAVHGLLRDWRGALAAGRSGPTAPRAGVDRLTDRTVATIRQRLGALIHFDTQFSAAWLYAAAAAELQGLASVLAESEPRADLLRLVADGAVLCGRLARHTGNHVAAQRYHLAALRAATAAGDVGLSVAVLGLHIGQYLDLGAVEEALTLADGAIAACETDEVGPRALALVLARTAAALVLSGDDAGAAAAERSAHAALLRGGTSPAPVRAVDSVWIDLVLGSARLRRDQPDKAVQRFERLLSQPTQRRPPLQAACYLLQAADALTATGRLAAASEVRDRATHLLSGTRTATPTAQPA